jgi:hypothetical protein
MKSFQKSVSAGASLVRPPRRLSRPALNGIRLAARYSARLWRQCSRIWRVVNNVLVDVCPATFDVPNRTGSATEFALSTWIHKDDQWISKWRPQSRGCISQETRPMSNWNLDGCVPKYVHHGKHLPVHLTTLIKH